MGHRLNLFDLVMTIDAYDRFVIFGWDSDYLRLLVQMLSILRCRNFVSKAAHLREQRFILQLACVPWAYSLTATALFAQVCSLTDSNCVSLTVLVDLTDWQLVYKSHLSDRLLSMHASLLYIGLSHHIDLGLVLYWVLLKLSHVPKIILIL